MWVNPTVGTLKGAPHKKVYVLTYEELLMVLTKNNNVEKNRC